MGEILNCFVKQFYQRGVIQMNKTWKKLKTLNDTVTAADVSAGKKIMFVGTGVPGFTTDPFVYTLSVKRGEVDYTFKTKHAYSTISGAIVVYDNSSDYVLTADDEVTVIGTYV
jgi:hypothetical protein